MSEAQWKQFVQLFSEKNQHLTKQQVLQHAKKPFLQLKKYFSQRGGATVDENIEFLLGGVVNPRRYQMPAQLACAVEPAVPAVPAVLTKFDTNRTFVEVGGDSPHDPNQLNGLGPWDNLHSQGYRMSNADLLNIFQHKYVWGLCKTFYGRTLDDAAIRSLVARIIANSEYVRKIGVIYERFKIISEYQSNGNRLFAGESVNTLTDQLQHVLLLFINIILSYKEEHRVIFTDASILTDLHNLRSCDMIRRIFTYYRDKNTAIGWGIVSMGNSIQTIITRGAEYIDGLYDYAITKLYSFGENLLRRGNHPSSEASPYDPEESEYFIKKGSHREIADPRKQLLLPEPPKKLISDDLKKWTLSYLRNQKQDTTPRTDAELIQHLKTISGVKDGILESSPGSLTDILERELNKLL